MFETHPLPISLQTHPPAAAALQSLVVVLQTTACPMRMDCCHLEAASHTRLAKRCTHRVVEVKLSNILSNMNKRSCIERKI